MPTNVMFTASGFRESIRNQDAEKSADQRRRDVMADLHRPAMLPIVITMPNTAATMPKPGIASAALVNTSIGL